MKTRVLVADDHAVRYGLRTLLELSGMQPIFAEDAAGAQKIEVWLREVDRRAGFGHEPPELLHGGGSPRSATAPATVAALNSLSASRRITLISISVKPRKPSPSRVRYFPSRV